MSILGAEAGEGVQTRQYEYNDFSKASQEQRIHKFTYNNQNKKHIGNKIYTGKFWL